MLEKQTRPYIQVPNLSVAFGVALVAIIVHILLNRILWDISGLGWFSRYNKIYLLQYILQTGAFFMFAQYLRNFKLNGLTNIFYSIFCLIIVYAIVPWLSYAFYGYSNTLVMVFASMSNLVSLVLGVLFFIAGFKLVSFQDDYIGGLRLLGATLILRSLVNASSFIFYLYNIFTSAYYTNEYYSTDLVRDLIYLAGMGSYILIFASMAYIYKRAMDYNSRIKQKPQVF